MSEKGTKTNTYKLINDSHHQEITFTSTFTGPSQSHGHGAHFYAYHLFKCEYSTYPYITREDVRCSVCVRSMSSYYSSRIYGQYHYLCSRCFSGIKSSRNMWEGDFYVYQSDQTKYFKTSSMIKFDEHNTTYVKKDTFMCETFPSPYTVILDTSKGENISWCSFCHLQLPRKKKWCSRCYKHSVQNIVLRYTYHYLSIFTILLSEALKDLVKPVRKMIADVLSF